MKNVMLVLAMFVSTVVASEALAARFVAKSNFGRGAPIVTNRGQIIVAHPNAQRARAICNQELRRWQNRSGRNPNARCVNVSHRPGRISCTSQARRKFGRGALLLSRTAWAHNKRNACVQARRQCNVALQNLRWRTGRYPNARCI